MLIREELQKLLERNRWNRIRVLENSRTLDIHSKLSDWQFAWEKELIYHNSHHGKDPNHERC